MNSRKTNSCWDTTKTFLGVFILNALLIFPVAFLIYKHFNPLLTPMDTGTFMDMAKNGFASLEPPYRYRYVTAFLVREMRFLPGYNIPIVFTDDPFAKKDFFHFLVLNFVLTVSTSSLLFLYLRKKLQANFAYLGSLLYLFSFYAVIMNLIPMSDATCHLAIIACVLSLENKKPFWFALVFLIGIFAKETILFVIPLWVLLRSFSDRSKLSYLLGLLPAIAAYFVVTHLNHVQSSQPYYGSSFLMHRALYALMPWHYSRSLVFHIFLSQATLVICLLLFIQLKISGKAKGIAPGLELFVVPFLIWVGITTDISNNTGRLLFLAFPAIVYFEAMIFQTVVTEYFSKDYEAAT